MSGRPEPGGVSEGTWLLASEQRLTSVMNSNNVICQQSKSKHKVSDVKRNNDCNDNNDNQCSELSELILMKPLEGATNSRLHEPASTKSKLSYPLSEKLFGNYFDSGTP